MVENLLNILIFNDFWHKRKMYNFDPYNVLLSIATNIPVLLMTAFVIQGHICPLASNAELAVSRLTDCPCVSPAVSET